ncbi:unnamed protein product [Chrysoparadoxa australica]
MRGKRAGLIACSCVITIASAFHPPITPQVSVATTEDGYVIESEEGRSRIPPLPTLKNRYFALRHGQSMANLEGIISSDPAIGTTIHGLTSSGKAQARSAATGLIESVGREDIDKLLFVSSDFTRAIETANECAEALYRITTFERSAESLGTQRAQVVVRKELRERFFGELEGTVLLNYNRVWPLDLKDAASDAYGVESVEQVISRFRSMMLELEQQYSDRCLVLTSHADTLQITQCYVSGVDERLFSQYRFRNAEVRELLPNVPSSLPAPRPLTFQ